jgi:hypothetical protein
MYKEYNKNPMGQEHFCVSGLKMDTFQWALNCPWTHNGIEIFSCT